jgi:hypothetical protein
MERGGSPVGKKNEDTFVSIFFLENTFVFLLRKWPIMNSVLQPTVLTVAYWAALPLPSPRLFSGRAGRAATLRQPGKCSVARARYRASFR